MNASFGKHVLTPTLALTSLAGATPPEWRVRYWDENLLQGAPPMEEVPQVVGISVHLTFAQRAYALAAWFKAHGCIVVMGGLHAMSCPDEVQAHADSICVGNGVPVWSRMLRDIEPELVNILTLMTAAVGRVEDTPRVQDHLARGRVRPWRRWGPRAIAGFAVLVLGLGVWLHVASGPEHSEPISPGVEFQGPSPTDAPDLITTEDVQTPSVAYPLPAQPFRNQAKAPCRTEADEVAINGGCWMALERRPPCSVTQAEYQGKCYMPVSENRGRLPQSVQP